MNIARMAASIGVDIHIRSLVVLKTRQQFPPGKIHPSMYYGWPHLAMSVTFKNLTELQKRRGCVYLGM